MIRWNALGLSPESLGSTYDKVVSKRDKTSPRCCPRSRVMDWLGDCQPSVYSCSRPIGSRLRACQSSMACGCSAQGTFSQFASSCLNKLHPYCVRREEQALKERSRGSGLEEKCSFGRSCTLTCMLTTPTWTQSYLLHSIHFRCLPDRLARRA